MSGLIQCFYDPSSGKIYQSVQEEPKGQFVSQVSREERKAPAKSKAPVQKTKAPAPKAAKRPQIKRQVRYLDEDDSTEGSRSSGQDDQGQESEQEERPRQRGTITKKQKGQRKPSAWTEHCKEYAARNQISYGAAISDPNCQEEYRSGK